MYNFFGREITKYTVIYNVHIWFWPTLCMCLSMPVYGAADTGACTKQFPTMQTRIA